MKKIISFLLVFVFCVNFAWAQTPQTQKSSISAIGITELPDSPEAVINNISGPDTLLVGQQGTWIVTATSMMASERMVFQYIINGVIVDSSVVVSQSAGQMFAAYFYWSFDTGGNKSLLFRVVSQLGVAERVRNVYVLTLNTNPIITHFSGNYGLLQYRTGHWTVKFLDQEQGMLKAVIAFGDGDTLIVTKYGLPGQEFTVTFEHSYKSAGIFTVRLKVDDLNGGLAAATWQVIVFPAITEVDDGLTITKFSLSQNYPNPFNPTTKIMFGLPTAEFVTLIVYDLLGTEVATLVNGQKKAGYYEIEFDAGNLPNGIYFYRLTAGSYTNSKKMILVK